MEVNYSIINDVESLYRFKDEMLAAHQAGELPFLSVDLETAGPAQDDGLMMFKPESWIVTVQVCWAPGQAVLIPLKHFESKLTDYVSMQAVHECLKELFEGIPVAGQNFKFDYKWLWCKLGIKCRTLYFDTMMAHQMLFTGERPNDLTFMAAEYVSMPDYTEELQQYKDSLPEGQRSFSNIPLDVILKYGCGDVDAVYRLVIMLWGELERRNLLEAYHLLYIDTFESSCGMEIEGMKIDEQMYLWLKQDYPRQIEETLVPIRQSMYYVPTIMMCHGIDLELATQVWEGTAPPRSMKKYALNLNSPKQKKCLLYQSMKMPNTHPKKQVSKSDGMPSADKDHIERLVDYCKLNGMNEELKVLGAVSKYTRYTKLHSSYIKSLPRLMYDKGNQPKDPQFEPFMPSIEPWCMHTNYNLAGTVTGRASTSDPPIHNMPYKSDIKRMYISRWRDRGGMHLQMDYAQMEIRVLAMLSGDPVLRDIIESGRDIHTEVTAAALQIPASEVDPINRRKGKTINFGIIYGQGAPGMAAKAGCSVEDAESFITSYMGQFVFVKEWMDKADQFVIQNGFAQCATGRVRLLSLDKLKAVYGDEQGARSALRRRAINTPIQGTASDLSLLGTHRCYHRMKREGMQSLMNLFVHDSLGMDCYPGEFFKAYDLMYDEMVNQTPLLYPWVTVPLKADCETGITWGNMVSMEKEEEGLYSIKGPRQNADALFYQLGLAGHKISTESDLSVDDEGNTRYKMHVENPILHG